MLSIVNNFLDKNDLDKIYNFFYYAGQWQFDFFKNEDKYKRNSEIENTFDSIVDKICLIDSTFISLAGYEIWVNLITKQHEGLDFHVDCNEYANYLDTAKKTAVLHIGKDKRLVGGDLLIDMTPVTDKYIFPKNIYEADNDTTNKFLRIPFKDNRLILFNSHYPHGVSPIKTIDKFACRIAVSISAWDKEIKIKRH